MHYFLSHLTGVWAMAFNREGWQDNFDRSVGGVFKSFWVMVPSFAIVLALSFILAPVLQELAAGTTQAVSVLPVIPGSILLFVRFIIDWMASLGLLLFVARKLGHQDRAVDIVLGYNWLQLMLNILFALPFLILSLTRSRELSGLVTLPLLVLSLVLIWGVLRRAMPGAAPPVTAGMIIGLFVLNILAHMITGFLSQPFLLPA